MDYSLGDLQKAAERHRERFNRRLRERYELARSLGFSPSEAKVLQSKTKETIVRLAGEKGRV
ncbi:hypothetical protein LCGC14_1450270 [marine sediment metagenome]|uniref:Uncharacterized protein n=1 Tax=marine sediment metagenome TaxID=412755 RepID=A0A0F9JI04_9ZZZZ